MYTINLYNIALYFDVTITGIVLCGFIFYLVKGPVSKEVTAGWFFMLLMLTFIILAGVILQSFNHYRLALLPLFMIAVTGIIYLCLLLLINILKIKKLRGRNTQHVVMYDARRFNVSAIQ